MKLRSVAVLGVSIVLAIVGFGWYLHARPEPETADIRATPSPVASVQPTSSQAPSPTPTPAWRTTDEMRKYTGTVPPVPRLLSIRPDIQPGLGFERMSFEFDTAQAPGYQIRRTTNLTQDASGIPVSIPGSTSYLVIEIDPAQAHTDMGEPTFTRARSATIAGTVLAGYAVTGDFEGRVTVGAGLRVPSAFRSSVERTNGRWVVTVDVRAN